MLLTLAGGMERYVERHVPRQLKFMGGDLMAGNAQSNAQGNFGSYHFQG